jgi:GT2 family glycosyltransferase
MQLSIIIVNFRSSRLIADCLRTLYAEPGSISFEVLVIDNDSGDDSYEFISRQFPQVSWTQMGTNAGFARANNQGIRQAGGEIILLLNPDTLIENQAIEKCYFFLDSSEYIACGVQLLNPDRSPQISGNFTVKGGLNILLPLPFIGHWIKSLGQLFNTKIPHLPDSDSIIPVDWINGAFLMVKRSGIDQAGLLDEDFFMYAEEAEWCSRLRSHGKLCINGTLHIIHLQGITANDAFETQSKGYYNLYDRKGLQILISNFVRLRKEFGIGWFLFNLFFYLLDIPVFLFGMMLKKLTGGKKVTYSFPQFKMYCKNLFTLLSLSPVIIRNKPHFYKFL